MDSLRSDGVQSATSRTVALCWKAAHLDVLSVLYDEFEAVSFVETSGGFVCWSDFQLPPTSRVPAPRPNRTRLREALFVAAALAMPSLGIATRKWA